MRRLADKQHRFKVVSKKMIFHEKHLRRIKVWSFLIFPTCVKNRNLKRLKFRYFSILLKFFINKIHSHIIGEKISSFKVYFQKQMIKPSKFRLKQPNYPLFSRHNNHHKKELTLSKVYGGWMVGSLTVKGGYGWACRSTLWGRLHKARNGCRKLSKSHNNGYHSFEKGEQNKGSWRNLVEALLCTRMRRGTIK